MIYKIIGALMKKKPKTIDNDDPVVMLAQLIVFSADGGTITVEYKATATCNDSDNDYYNINRFLLNDGKMRVHVNNVPVPDNISAELMIQINEWIRVPKAEIRNIMDRRIISGSIYKTA